MIKSQANLISLSHQGLPKLKRVVIPPFETLSQLDKAEAEAAVKDKTARVVVPMLFKAHANSQAITQIWYADGKLYTSSYDETVKCWAICADKPDTYSSLFPACIQTFKVIFHGFCNPFCFV